MYLKPSLHLSRSILETETSIRDAGGNIALLRCLVWQQISSQLRLERVRFFENDNGYVLLAGASRKYLISSNWGSNPLGSTD